VSKERGPSCVLRFSGRRQGTGTSRSPSRVRPRVFPGWCRWSAAAARQGVTGFVLLRVRDGATGAGSDVMAAALQADVVEPEAFPYTSLEGVDLVGFGSGVSYGRMHEALFEWLRRPLSWECRDVVSCRPPTKIPDGPKNPRWTRSVGSVSLAMDGSVTQSATCRALTCSVRIASSGSGPPSASHPRRLAAARRSDTVMGGEWVIDLLGCARCAGFVGVLLGGLCWRCFVRGERREGALSGMERVVGSASRCATDAKPHDAKSLRRGHDPSLEQRGAKPRGSVHEAVHGDLRGNSGVRSEMQGEVNPD